MPLLLSGDEHSSGAAPGQVLVSPNVRNLVVVSGIEFDILCRHGPKGMSGDWQLYAAIAPLAEGPAPG